MRLWMCSEKFFPEVLMFFRSVVLVLAVSLTCIGTHPQSSPEHEAELKKDMAELQSYTLTMDIVNRTVVTMSAIRDAVKSDPALEKASKDTADKAEGQATLSQMSSIISSSPKLTAIVAGHGFYAPQICVVRDEYHPDRDSRGGSPGWGYRRRHGEQGRCQRGQHQVVHRT